MRITEDDVVNAASLWAERECKSQIMVTSSALEVIDGLKNTLRGETYMDALKNLYEQYVHATQG
jgi:hypothetical protein